MEAIEIRAAKLDDADAAACYYHRCFTNTYSSQLPAGELDAPDKEGTRQQLHDWLRPESEFETWAAVVDDVPIGHFMVSGHQLARLFVEPDHQGIGLGRRLLAQGEATSTSWSNTVSARFKVLKVIPDAARRRPRRAASRLGCCSECGGLGETSVQVIPAAASSMWPTSISSFFA